jgi:hypothetical protein
MVNTNTVIWVLLHQIAAMFLNHETLAGTGRDRENAVSGNSSMFKLFQKLD